MFDSTVRTLLASGSKLGIALLDQSITQQAAMIAYVDDFKLMFIATLLAIPLLVLIRSPRAPSTGEAASHAAID